MARRIHEFLVTWLVLWQDESGTEIDRLDDPDFPAELVTSANVSTTTTCLRFIDPYRGASSIERNGCALTA